MSSLPAPRDILTSLITSLSAPTRQDLASGPNPLRDVPNEKTALLSALHVLFPSLLLPALDLLDRGLVTRVLRKSPAGSRGGEQEPERKGNQTGVSGEETTAGSKEAGVVGAGDEDAQRSGFHMVRSLASTMKRREGGYYIVFLDTWNCTCPTFAFDAFPPVTSTSGLMKDEKGGGGEEAGDPEQRWTFGGLSTDGLEDFGASVPCCKHLLACVLAERWADVLGSYVPVKRVGKGEIAGLVADV